MSCGFMVTCWRSPSLTNGRRLDAATTATSARLPVSTLLIELERSRFALNRQGTFYTES